jgi:serine/threonine protein kinase
MQRAQVVDERYGLVEPIGGGGMGSVWLAEDRRLKRNVAVKFLKAEFADDDELRTRFEIEAQAMAKINHPSVAEIFDVGHEGTQPYIVMEYVEGVTLTAFMRDHAPLREATALKWLENIARGVAAIHRRNVIHRDLKPNNILLPEGGEREYLVKIVDFGIARNLNSASITTELGRLFYTPNYAAPEQTAGLTLTPASDVYTLGVILYEMLGGTMPVNLFALRNRVSPGMFSLLNKLLQHDPTARPPYGGAVVDLIRHFDHADDTTRPEPSIAPAQTLPPVVAVVNEARPDDPTRMHHAQPPLAPSPKPKAPGVGERMRNGLQSIQNRPAEELSPIALIVDLFSFIGAGMLWLLQLTGRSFASAGRRIGASVQSHAGSAAQGSPALGQRARQVAGAASNSVYAALYNLINGMVIGAIGGAVGGIGGWFFWSWTNLSTLNDFWTTLLSFDLGAVLSFFIARIAPWSLTAGMVGAVLAGGIGLLMGFLGGNSGSLATRSLFTKLVYSFFGAIGAVIWGLFLTFTHLLLAAIPLGLWALSDPGVNMVLLRVESFGTLIEDILYWAALGSIGWGITLTLDMLLDRAISRTPFGKLVQVFYSALLGAVALGGGSFILWLVLSAVGLREALNPETILTHLQYDVAVKVGLIGGLLIALLRPSPKPPVVPINPTPAPRGPQRQQPLQPPPNANRR